ncbi:protein windpipe [Agrilus planipennis]|uniref:Protein windpipe n=1 Tax=Agrilus planipennis TaxID=224129 RepID=A0A1W4X2G8_AGRPL|nr:protein windpipe [Agrilus planipennis]XP_018326971.1 protein windpipe [Agrilus planipennis]XP_018326972.1 protein windpipe [Agrilus planipennis]XP_018326973.1 protein windpipe [Agrilus planipennis]XP_018326974.1 protein windpipe [Agrilus planipennis]
MLAITWALIAIISCTYSAPLLSCPKSCSCISFGRRMGLTCSSLDFLRKPLSPELQASIVILTVRGKNIHSLDPKLKHLRNLKFLDVSSSGLKHFTASVVPKGVESLDISNNDISYVSDWNLLPELKSLDITGNPLSCSCDSLPFRDMLLSNTKVRVVEPVLCDSPKEHFGKSWLKVNCIFDPEFLFGEMQGDEPVEGSGSGDGWAGPIIADTHVTTEDSGPVEEEFIKDNQNVVNSAKTITEQPPTEDEEEGSGSFEFVDVFNETNRSSTTVSPFDADYDDEEEQDGAEGEPTTVISQEQHPAISVHRGFISSGCIINCSTPAPLDRSDDSESSPPPGLVDGVKIIMGDIFGVGQPSTQQPEQSSTAATDAKQEQATEVKEEVSQTHLSEQESAGPKESPKKETDIISETADTTKEKESAVQSQESKQSNSTFIFLGILLLVMVCLIVYAVVKRAAAKKKGRKQRSNVAGLDEKPGEEMKLIKPIGVENGKQNGKPESIPLINNSQNGTKTYPEDEKVQKKEPVTPPGTPADDEDDVELRQKPNDSLLTPETKRVTIRASEIPDSVLKTPILVTRHIDSDGKVVTTPNLNQRSVK